MSILAVEGTAAYNTNTAAIRTLTSTAARTTCTGSWFTALGPFAEPAQPSIG
jgi:hypothetical protein